MKSNWMDRFRGMQIHGSHEKYVALAISCLVLTDMIFVITLILWFRGFFG